MHYTTMLGGTAKSVAISAAVLSVRLNILQDALGPQPAVEVLKALGEYTNSHFNAIGGFSARYSRDQILTVFPHTSVEEAKELVSQFARKLQEGILDNINGAAQANIDAKEGFDIYIRAGITEVLPNDKIEQIIERAEAGQEIIATHRCNCEGSIQ